MSHPRTLMRLWFPPTLALAALGCGGSASEPGAVFVTVAEVYKAFIADAVVSTEPATRSAHTDVLGTVLLDKLPTGFYAVTAEHPTFGTGRAPVTVRAGRLTELTLTLRKTEGAGSDAGPANDAGSTDAYPGDGNVNDAGGPDAYPDGSSANDAGRDAPLVDPTGAFIQVNSQVERMVVDPRRPYIYAVDKVNNSLHFINLTTKAIEKTVFVGSIPVDLAINLAGTELFVANFGSTEIAVVNLETREKVRGVVVDISKGTWSGNPYRLVCTAGDTLVYTSEDQWNDLKLVTAATGAFVATAGSIYYPALATSPDGTRVYVGESGSTGTSVIRFDVVGNTLRQIDTSTSLSFGSRQVSVTRDGMYVFYARQKYLANNLKSVLGTFSETIILSNLDGSIAVGPTKIHDATTFAAIKALPLMTSVMAISPDDKTLYLYDTMTSRIYLHQL